ncbi:unnamed protein product [Peniophora sp. CBMAI 1063]|nr:unnamed protein product [Peniophora sp. CBMAI 1063]
MFGEDVSESPRGPSPWDKYAVLSSSPGVEQQIAYSPDVTRMPKLSAEIEEGNVEYKLHLLHPSSARFNRLVTQLKWRLLEGGGCALYELGVADDGALVGLPPPDAASSFSTLQAMAAEIGASARIIRHIELVGARKRAEDARELAHRRRDRERDRPKAKTLARQKWLAKKAAADASVRPSMLDDEEAPALVEDRSPSASPSPPTYTPHDPPALSDFDEGLALFTMDAELDAGLVDFAVPPLKMKQPKSTRRPLPAPPVVLPVSLAPSLAPTVITSTITLPASPVPIPGAGLTKAEKRRISRDARRAERRRALAVPVPGLDREASAPTSEDSDSLLPASMEDALAVSMSPMEILGVSVSPADATGVSVSASPADALLDDLAALSVSANDSEFELSTRIIVEVLVTRLADQDDDDGAFLDFEHI